MDLLRKANIVKDETYANREGGTAPTSEKEACGRRERYLAKLWMLSGLKAYVVWAGLLFPNTRHDENTRQLRQRALYRSGGWADFSDRQNGNNLCSTLVGDSTDLNKDDTVRASGTAPSYLI